jgi:hypothetical protein
MLANREPWQRAKERASQENGWFVEAFIDLAINNISSEFLDRSKLTAFAHRYGVPDYPEKTSQVGVVMAGNIPLVGFHDFLCVLLSGHSLLMKPASKDEVLIKHLAEVLWQQFPETRQTVGISSMLKGCDAYIATGSNNTSRYFEYYFGKYPHIIRKNRTSAAILSGSESAQDLELLADDMLMYFGLGCRNVSKLFVPEEYNFVPLLGALNKYAWMADHHKFKNNYDYNLSLHLLNNKYYMTNGTLLLIEDKGLFSPISQVNYEYYDGDSPTESQLPAAETLQCLVSASGTGFGLVQSPSISSFADGVDTMKFLVHL